MVDIVTNRMFDAFSRLAPTEKRQNESLATIGDLKRFANDQRIQRVSNRRSETKVRSIY